MEIHMKMDNKLNKFYDECITIIYNSNYQSSEILTELHELIYKYNISIENIKELLSSNKSHDFSKYMEICLEEIINDMNNVKLNNVEYYKKCLAELTDENIKAGVIPELYASHKLIIKCINDKDYINFYPTINAFDSDIIKHKYLDDLQKNKVVIHNGDGLFGFYKNHDGDDCIVYPSKNKMMLKDL